LALYGLVCAGGTGLLVAACASCVVAAFVTAAVAARFAGASARSVTLLVPASLVVAPWLLQLRTQTLALPLFVTVYALLARDARMPSHRVYLVVPLLVLWGNLHGSAALGALLVAGHGMLRRGR